jgi:glycine/D-amino acid oxidase-like deaminating enzyme
MTADLAIIGGGVVGCFASHQAARSRPHWRVVLLERTSIGAGATGWSAGVSFPLAASPAHRDLVRASAAGYAALDDATVQRCIRPVRTMYVVARDREAALRYRLVDAALRPVTDDETRTVARMLPDLRLAADEVLVTHDRRGFAVDARALAETLVACAGAGVEVRLGQTVRAVQRRGDTYRVLTDSAEWSTRRVVMASGPWPPPTVRPVPLAEPPGARRKRVAALHVALPVAPGDPLVYFLDDDLFILPLSQGAALVSFYRDVWDADPDSLDGRPSDDDLRSGAAVLRRRSAAAAGAVTGGRTFCDLYTEHRLPVVTSHPALPGLVAIRGGSGSGVRLAPALAAEALRSVDPLTPSTDQP